MSERYAVTRGFLLAAVLLLVLSFQNSEAQDDFVPDELIIKLKKTAIRHNFENDLTLESVEIMEEIPELGVLVVRTPPEDSIDAKRDFLSDNPNFEYVEKNFIYEANVIPNDQFFNFQDYMGVISAPSAWDTEQGSSNTVIAVLDTGVQAIHEDLSTKVLTGCSTLGGFNENNCGPNTDDVHGHGSGVSGTAAAKTNNTVGVAGVCWDCVILPMSGRSGQHYCGFEY